MFIDSLSLRVPSTGVQYGVRAQIWWVACARDVSPCTSGLLRLSNIFNLNNWIIQQTTRITPVFRFDAGLCAGETNSELVCGARFSLGRSFQRSEISVDAQLRAYADDKVVVGAIFVGLLPRQVSLYIAPVIEAGLISVKGIGVVDRCVGLEKPNNACSFQSCFDARYDESSQQKSVEIHAEPRCCENLKDLLSIIYPELCAAAALAQQRKRAAKDMLISRLVTGIRFAKNASDQGLDLFSAHEQLILNEFSESSRAAKYLAIRLLQRRTPRTRISSIKMYFESPKIQSAVDELIDRGLAFSSCCVSRHYTTADIKAICESLARDELTQFADYVRNNLPSSRGSMIDVITHASTDGGARFGHCSSTKILYKIKGGKGADIELNGIADIIGVASSLKRTLRTVLLFLFLQRSGIDWLMIEDIRATRFTLFDMPMETLASTCPAPAFDISSNGKQKVIMTTCVNSVCTSAPAFAAFAALCEKSTALDLASEAGDSSTVFRILSHDFLPHFFSAGHQDFIKKVVCSTSFHIVNAIVTYMCLLEKHGYYENATVVLVKSILSVFHPKNQSLWLVHTSSNLSRIHARIRDALEVNLSVLRNPLLHYGVGPVLQQRVRRLARLCNHTSQLPESLFVDVETVLRVDNICARALNANAKEKKRYASLRVGMGRVSLTVEDLALLHYAGDDCGNWRGVHVESRFWTMLFSLLFADVIFMPVVGAFRSPFQSTPFDMYTANFTSVRLSAINQRLASIRRGDSRTIIIRSWSAHFGRKISGIFWHLLRIEDLCDILDGIGGMAIHYMMKLLMLDYRVWSIGAPDLILWRKTTNSSAEVKFVEVKSSNDHLTERQQAWLSALYEAGVDVAICKVSS